ncbi:hypothetical protein [Rhizobium ruizarguesonis]|uniref:hypothetical protein n=1 Tax=Rhizobium ruizarguesonis TaxID=2081791 RepID=UPI001FE0135D|nr:hypothetical protein [Rhizobium ruizarguesonis]
MTASVCMMLALVSGAYAATLTGEQLKSELVGHTIHWKSKSGSGITIYKEDGKIEATVDGDKNNYTGDLAHQGEPDVREVRQGSMRDDQFAWRKKLLQEGRQTHG